MPKITHSAVEWKGRKEPAGRRVQEGARPARALRNTPGLGSSSNNQVTHEHVSVIDADSLSMLDGVHNRNLWWCGNAENKHCERTS